MSNTKELYTCWLNAKDELRKRFLRIDTSNKSGDAENAIHEYDAGLQYFIDSTRKMFDRDEKRIKVRDETIRYLQDQLAERTSNDVS